MSHAQRHIPLGPPLIDGLPHRECMACVIIPARNEEASLERTLQALQEQRDHNNVPLDPATYEVILLLNNCTDRSEEIARSFASTRPEFCLHVVQRQLPAPDAHVGMARRLLMDTAYDRLRHSTKPYCAILSTDGDTVVAPDWVARNMAAIEAGADVVGGVIHLFPDELEQLSVKEPATAQAYRSDREFQAKVARLESLLDPDPADPWPRHLEHFGASLACTPAIYALCGGLPPVKPLEDVAFVDELRKVGARIRHCPETHIFTSARLDGRAEIGLSGQLRHWQRDGRLRTPHMVDSADWLTHRFRTLELLRRFNEASLLPDCAGFPALWQQRLASVYAERLPTPRFLELLDCDRLIEDLFEPMGKPRYTTIAECLQGLSQTIVLCETTSLAAV